MGYKGLCYLSNYKYSKSGDIWHWMIQKDLLTRNWLICEYDDKNNEILVFHFIFWLYIRKVTSVYF
jgi:hypothetical protein